MDTLDDYIEDARAKDQLGWDNDDDRKRYALVEQSWYDDSYYVTTFDDPEEAAGYHDNQEYPEDWKIEGLFDRFNGDVWYAVPTTRWELKPE